MRDSSRKAGDILKNLLENRGWTQEDPYSPVFLGWKSIVGTSFADHCWLVEIREGTCIVEADHPGWLQLLGMEKDRLLRSIREKAPAAGIREIRFKLSSGSPEGH